MQYSLNLLPVMKNDGYEKLLVLVKICFSCAHVLVLLGTDSVLAAGCGKRTVIRYIARRLGLHVVEYSCHNLVASSEKKMSISLAQTLNTAQR